MSAMTGFSYFARFQGDSFLDIVSSLMSLSQQVHHTPDPLPSSVAPKGEGGIQCEGCGLWTLFQP